MKVIEWNVHGLMNSRCPAYVANEINRLNSDVVILTEYVENINYNGKFETYMKTKYFLCRQPQLIEGNGILIAIKKSDRIRIDCRKRIWRINDIPNTSSPDFLHTFMEYNEQPISIIGMRVKTYDNYINRRKQVETVIEYINNLDEVHKSRVIVMGDFNNSQILGDENKYNEIKQYKGKDTENYNLQILKSDFKAAGFYVFNSTPKGNVYNKYSQLISGFPYKQDHIFVKGMNVSDTEYDWSYKEQNYIRDIGRDPDHAILKANIEI